MLFFHDLPKGLSESVYQRRTDNTMTKRKDKQRSTKHTHKTNTNTTKTGGLTELGCSVRIFSSCSTSDTRRVNLVTNPVISHERGKEREVFTTSGTYPCPFVTQILHNGQPSHGGDRTTLDDTNNLAKRNPWFSSFLRSSKPLSTKFC